MIDQVTIQKIFDAARIEEIVSEFVTLKKKGVNLVGLCPFHDDKTPSFYVSPVKGVCKCFACGKGGNAVHFVMEHEQMSYPEALKWIARKYHIEVEEKELTAEQRNAQSERESLFIVNQFACKYFQHTLKNHIDGRSIGQAYFRSRGVRDDIVEKFCLGYCTTEKDAFAREAIRKGYRKELLVKSGVCYEKEDGSIRDRFWGRVIFPWFNISGKVVGFGGRVLDSRTKGVQQKYVNSPESDIYSKRKELYGLYQAKQAIVRADHVYMVEGYTDVIAMHQCGLENVVANSGTALSETQIRLLHRFTQNITLIYDGDEAGIKASLRGIDMLLAEGMNVKVLLLPEGEDPDSFSRQNNADYFRKYISQHEVNFIRFKTGLLLKDAKGDPVKLASLVQDIAHSIGLVPNEILRYSYLKECASLLSVDEQIILNEVRNVVEGRTEENVKRHADTLPDSTDSTIVPDKKETELARILVRYGECEVCVTTDEDGSERPVSVAEYIYYDLSNDEIQFAHPVYWRMVEEAVACVGMDRFVAERHFLHHPDSEISSMAASLVSDRFTLSRSNERDMTKDVDRLTELVPHLLLEYKLGILKEEMKQVMNQLSMPEIAADAQRTMEVMKRYKELSEIMQTISKSVGERIVL
jgi:DNA primase